MKYLYQIEPRLSRIHRDVEVNYILIPIDTVVFLVGGQRFAGKTAVATGAAKLFGFPILEPTRGWLDDILEMFRSYGRPRHGVEGLILDGTPDPAAFGRLRRYLRTRPECIWVSAPKEERSFRASRLYGRTWRAAELDRSDRTTRKQRTAISRMLGHGATSDQAFWDFSGTSKPEEITASLRQQYPHHCGREVRGF